MEEDRKLVIEGVLANARLRYSPVLEGVLRFLIDSYVSDAEGGVLGKEIAFQVFRSSGRSVFDDKPRVRAVMARLRKYLRKYFEDDPKGRTSAYTVGIENHGRGYHLAFHPQTQPRPPLRVFLCHSTGDKARVREVYERLTRDGFAPWLDEEDLLPGENWETEITKAVRSSEVVLVCLSTSSVTKQGFVQKEIKMALDAADEKADGTIYIIPVRFEDCAVPERLKKWQWVNFFEPKGYDRLLGSLRVRGDVR